MGNLSNIFNGSFNNDPLPPEEQLKQKMRDNSIEPPDTIILDGNLHRFSTGPGGRDDAGWYVGYSDNIPAGAFGDWRADTTVNWIADIGRQLSEAEKISLSRRSSEARARRDEERKRKQIQSANTVLEIWEGATPADGDHPYLKRKQISPNGSRTTGDGRLIVPLYENGMLSSLQYISQDGEKRYHPGGATSGCFWVLGSIVNAEKIYIAEGFATAATIYEETNIPTVVAYSANNLPKAAEKIRSLYENLQIIITADNDESGIGENKANEAAAKTGGTVSLCPVQGDFNDYKVGGGNVRGFLSKSDNLIDKLGVLDSGEISEEYTPPDELIQDVLVKGRSSVIYGDSNSGKTFFALSLARDVAMGWDCYGNKVEQGSVLYLAIESPGSIYERLQAMKKHHGKNIENIFLATKPVNFYSNPTAYQDVIKLVEELNKKAEKPINFIIFDTLSQLCAGANENDVKDMQPIMQVIEKIAQETNTAVTAIHHSGKDKTKGVRGSSAIYAHLDTVINVTDEGDYKTAEISKQRSLGTKGLQIHYELKIVEMGIGKFGDIKSTCVAVPYDGEVKNNEQRKENNVTKFTKRFQRIWESTGMELAQGKPYITKSAYKDVMISDGGKERTVKNDTMPSYQDRFCGCLLDSGVIKIYGPGWVIEDKIVAEKLILIKNEHEKIDKFSP